MTRSRVVMRDELRLRLQAGIDSLSEDFRTVFMLRGVQGTAAADVAHAPGISSVTVRTCYFRARRLLRSVLGDPGPAGHGHAFRIVHAHHDHILSGVLGRGKQLPPR